MQNILRRCVKIWPNVTKLIQVESEKKLPKEVSLEKEPDPKYF